MRSLFEITEDFIELERRLESEDSQELLDWMTDLSKERQNKIDAYCWMIRKLETEADAAAKVAFQFEEKARARKGAVLRMKTAIMDHMKATGNAKLVGNNFTVGIQKNGGVRPVQIENLAAVPAELCETQRVPLRDEIRKRLEAGEYVPGAVLGERGESIRIK